jgi:RNA polymerase sigma-70 factor (ECF subfamily)
MPVGGSTVDTDGVSLLVMRAQAGDVAAFEQLLLRMHGPLRQYLNNLAGAAAADDILQEVACKVYRKIKHLREPGVFMAWTFRIPTRVAFDHLKRAKQWRELENDPKVARSLTASSSGREGLEPDFLELVSHASPASRAVLLHYQQHLSIEEVAAILDIPVGTAKSRLSYGIAAIRKHIKEKEEDE